MFDVSLVTCGWIVLPPLFAALLTGLGQPWLSRTGAHTLAIGAVALSAVASLGLAHTLVVHQVPSLDATAYTWLDLGATHLQVGFYLDALSATMACVVTLVSLCVHIYTINYMADDPSYHRFFSHIALFTFAMLMLVLANNLVQLFFGWEAVGLVSYLLIGFWHHKPSAVSANLKAFLVNRVGDLGFLMGMAALFVLCHTLDYSLLMERLPEVSARATFWHFGAWHVPALSVAAFGLFLGAMGKSAQMPLHVWLPDSMEGPTPISALIHAATMVTAGIFMVVRLAPLFEACPEVQTFMLVVGAATCFFMGLLGIVQHDIKRVVAYSTLSQLGYMIAGLGASAYALSLFHLITHAFFKALLFLGAGAVIMALHHEQDMRRMGGLWRRLPITHLWMLVGSLSLMGFPGFSGFYSKDLLVEAVHGMPGQVGHYAAFAVQAGVLITSMYAMRLLFLVFYGRSRMTQEVVDQVHEPGMATWFPLLLLAIPSVVLGAFLMPSTLALAYTGDFVASLVPVHPEWAHMAEHASNVQAFTWHGWQSRPFALLALGVALVVFAYGLFPKLPAFFAQMLAWPYRILCAQYGFNHLNERLLVPTVRALGWLFWRFGDRFLIDGTLVHGLAYRALALGRGFKRWHTGSLRDYIVAAFFGLAFIFMGLSWTGVARLTPWF